MKTSPIKGLKNNKFYSLVALILISMAYPLNSTAATSETWLRLSPDQCVSVHQGAKCFADIQISWKMAKVDNYCLFSSQQALPLQCWQNSNKGQFKQEFVSEQNITFYLRLKSANTNLITKELEMAWVYKKNSRARASWRMF